MEFRILGPVEVSEGDRLLEIGGAKPRALLASLLLHANEVVSQDRLIDDLWGQTPPATAAKTLQAHVSRLRSALNSHHDSAARSPLQTHGRGYRLAVEPGQLDADNFRQLLEGARRAMAEGQPSAAAEQAQRALALWRGPALADLAYEAFAQEEIARLDELRLNAQEERIEAELALGRHRELIGELEPLVAAHPLRERLRGQLMLALYRSDRQAEALQTYQQGRQALAEELGLTPSPGLQRLECQILEHDPALTAPAAARSAAPRRRWPLVAVVALVVASAVGATIVQLAPDDGSAARGVPSLDESGVSVLDPVTGALVSAIPLGTAPANVAVGEGGVWVLDADDQTISKIDPREHVLLRTFSAGATPTSLAVGAGAIWLGTGSDESSYPTRVSRLDPESGVVDATIPLPGSDVRGYFQGGGTDQQLIAVADDAVWAVNPDQTLSRIDPRSNRVVARIKHVRATSVAAGEGAVWVVDTNVVSDDSPHVVEIEPETNTIARRFEVAAASLTSLAIGAGAVWIADPVGGSVWRLDDDRQHLLRTIPLGVGVRWVAFGDGAIWATNEAADTVHRIDPTTNRAQTVSRVAAPTGVAVGDGVWVSSAGRPAADATLPSSACAATPAPTSRRRTEHRRPRSCSTRSRAPMARARR